MVVGCSLLIVDGLAASSRNSSPSIQKNIMLAVWFRVLSMLWFFNLTRCFLFMFGFTRWCHSYFNASIVKEIWPYISLTKVCETKFTAKIFHFYYLFILNFPIRFWKIFPLYDRIVEEVLYSAFLLSCFDSIKLEASGFVAN